MRKRLTIVVGDPNGTVCGLRCSDYLRSLEKDMEGDNMKITIPSNIKSYMKQLEDNGFEAYVVGGAIRDSILSETPKDWDIFTNASGEQILELFPDGKIIGGKDRRNKIFTVLMKGGVEISTYRKSGDRKEAGNTIDDHIATCDFTINAIASDKDGNIYDPVGGYNDLCDNIIIKSVGNASDRMNEDELRAFRGVRFWSKYDCQMSTPTLHAIQSTNIKSVSPERIRDELCKILRYEKGLMFLKDTNLLGQFWPEFIDMVGMDGGHYHNEDVWTHTDLSYRYSCSLTDNVMHHIAVALHDIGKPPCHNSVDGSFKGHNVKGSIMAKEMMERLGFSKQDIDYVTTLIRHHLFGISSEPRIDKGYRRLYKDLERISKKENTSYPNMVEDLTLLFYCDYQGNTANNREKFADYLTNKGHMGTKIFRNYYSLKSKHEPFSISDLKINGTDIINMGINEGKRIGQLLKQVFNLTTEGILQNERHEQMFWLREQIRIEKEITQNR